MQIRENIKNLLLRLWREEAGGFWSSLFGGGGASPQMKDIAGVQQSLVHTMAGIVQDVFSKDTQVFNTLMRGLVPIFAAGPSRYAFSPAEESAYMSRITESMAAANQQMRAALGEVSARSGMTTAGGVTPALAQAEARAAQGLLSEKAQMELGVIGKGFQTGREEFWKAAQGIREAPGVLGGAAPYGEQAIKAGEVAYGSAAHINQLQRSKLGWLKGLIGAGLSMIPGVGPFAGAMFKAATTGQAPEGGMPPIWSRRGGGGSTATYSPAAEEEAAAGLATPGLGIGGGFVS